MMLKKAPSTCYLVLLILVFSFGENYGQSTEIDSLRSLVNEAPRDTALVNNLNALSIAVLRNEGIEESLELSGKAAALAEELKFLKGRAYAEKNIGMAYYYQGNYLEVLEYWTRSLATFESIKDNQGIANLASNLGAVYYSQGSNTKAIDYYLRALGIAEEIDDTFRIATTLLNIGGLYGDTAKDYDKAEEYFNRIPPYLETLDDPQLTAAYLLGIGEVYFNQGLFEKAEEKYLEALPVTVNTPEESINLRELGKVEFKIGDQDAAIKYLTKAYDIAREKEQQLQMVQALVELGKVYQNNDYPKALGTFKEAEQLAGEMGIKFELKDIYEGLAVAYANQGDYNNAYKYQNLLITQKDSLFNLETDDKIRGLQFEYDLLKKQDEIGMLEQQAEITNLQVDRQKYVIYATILGLIILVILAVGAYKKMLFVRKTNKIIETEKNRSQQLLHNILPEETATELMENGKVAAKKFDSVSVMFTDFKGFTSTSESLSPEILVKSVDFYFSRFDEIIEKYDLEKIKTIGDSYMCAAGIHSLFDDHAQKMIMAAREIVDVMNDPRIDENPDLRHFEVRVGINTGPVVAGVVGIKKFAYDIWGDTVNVAARMESKSEPGKINISENTYSLVKDEFTCTYRGELDVKNRGKLKMYFVDSIEKRTYQKPVELSEKLVKGEL